jgi:hypothetical protein
MLTLRHIRVEKEAAMSSASGDGTSKISAGGNEADISGDAAVKEPAAKPPGKSFAIKIDNTPFGPLKGTVEMFEPARGKPPSPWLTEIPKAVITLITASLVGGVISMAFNYKSWRENQRIDRAKTDMSQAVRTFSMVNETVAKRIHQTFLLMRNIEEGIDPASVEDRDNRRAIYRTYKQTVEDWNSRIRLLVKQSEFDIDDIASKPDNESYDMVGIMWGEVIRDRAVRCDWKLPDSKPKHKDVDWNQSAWVLAALHSCFIEYSGNFSKEWDSIEENPDREERARKLQPHRNRLFAMQEHAMRYTHVASINLRSAKNATKTRDFREYILDW